MVHHSETVQLNRTKTFPTGIALRVAITTMLLCSLWACTDESAKDNQNEQNIEPPGPPAAPELYFMDLTEWTGLNVDSRAHGACFVDITRDGIDDIVLPRSDDFEVYVGKGNGRYEAQVDVIDEVWTEYSYAIDLTGDGINDVLVVNPSEVAVYETTDDGTLLYRPDLLRISDESVVSSSATFGDFNQSGVHDIYIARQIQWDPEQNSGHSEDEVPAPDLFMRWNGTKYEDVTAKLGLDTVVQTLATAVVDLNHDGWLDLLVGTRSQVPDLYYLGSENGDFAESSESLGIFEPNNPKRTATSAMGFAVADIDGDEDFDMVVTDWSEDYGTKLYEQTSPGKFQYATLQRGLAQTQDAVGWGVGLHDFDHDGDIDLFIANGAPAFDSVAAQPAQFFLNDGTGHFTLVSAPENSALNIVEGSKGAIFGDIDGDGDLDIIVSNHDAPPTVMRNELGDGGNWLHIDLQHPTLSPAVGAIVTLQANNQRLRRWVMGTPSYGGSSSRWIHFGLADANEVTNVEVQWPDGSVERYDNAKANQRIVLKKGTGSPI